MEITIDAALVRGILTSEHAQAREEISAAGVLRALANSQRRHDERIASAADVGTLDCRAGCAWCCHFSVDVRAAEVFGILDFVERTFPDEQKTRIRAEVRANSLVLRGLDETSRMKLNLRCPFLDGGRCTIYAVRPQTCRNYHATNVAGCRRSYEEPGNLDIDPEFAPEVYQAGGAHVEAFGAAMSDAGYDAGVYELNCAVDAALSDAGARARFESRSAPFKDLHGETVHAEFDELASE